MALAGVGVDIVEIARVERAIARNPHFAERVFTPEERAYCEGRPRPAEHYACRFAAREAVLKALGTGFAGGIGWQDVSVVRDASGRPRAVLAGRAAEAARERGVEEVALSLSFTRELAVANAVAVTEAARPRRDEAPDPKAALAASFREARSLIDELERVEQDGPADEPDAGDGGTADVPAAGDGGPGVAGDGPSDDDTEGAPAGAPMGSDA